MAGAGDQPLDGDVVEVLYVKFITACSQSLRLVECPEFRAFLTYLNKDINRWLNASHNTIKEWVFRQHKIEEEKMMQRVQNARSKVHISTDLWTSPNAKPIMVIVGHYISEDNDLEHSVLDLVEVEGSHRGENLAPLTFAVICRWGVTSKLGFFMMDNASNNDTMMRRLSSGSFFGVFQRPLG